MTSVSPTIPSGSPLRLVSFGILLVPVVLFYGVLAHHLVNFPRDDDLFSIVPFLNQWTETVSWSERLNQIAAQYYSHRIILTKCVAVLVQYVAGHCDFIVLQLMGWAAWLGIAALLLRSSEHARSSPLVALPVMFVLMQPQGATNFLIAMQAIQNLGVIFLSFAALFFVVRPGRGPCFLAITFALLASLTSVNGLLVFPVAVLVLAVQNFRVRCVVFAALGLVTWALFFLNYTNSSAPFDFTVFLHHAAIMAGAPLMFGTLGFNFATGAGIMILLAAGGAIFISIRHQRTGPLGAFLLFVVLSVAMAARGRIGWGPEYMEQDRYRVYGLLALALVYLIVLAWLPANHQRKFAITSICAGGFFCLLSYASYLPRVTTASRLTEAMPMNRQLERSYATCTSENWDEALKNTSNAIQRDVIQNPKLLSATDLAFLARLDFSPSGNESHFFSQANEAFCGYTLSPSDGEALPVPAFTIMLHEGRPLLLPVNNLRTTLWDLPKKWSFYSDRFQLILPERLYRRGFHHLIGIARDQENNLTVIWRSHVILP